MIYITCHEREKKREKKSNDHRKLPHATPNEREHDDASRETVRISVMSTRLCPKYCLNDVDTVHARGCVEYTLIILNIKKISKYLHDR
jgi:hypothetical protein